jgi:hypothetical protein
MVRVPDLISNSRGQDRSAADAREPSVRSIAREKIPKNLGSMKNTRIQLE